MEASICRIVVTVFLASSIMSFFSFVTVRRWLLSASDRAWNSCSAISVSIAIGELVWREQSHLCLARLALMVRHTDFVKDAVQLVNAAVDLLGEAGVHGEQDQPPQAA